jgi:protein-arginine kinase activator protein McsA
MGEKCGYSCQDCGYSASVSGGEDVGMASQTDTGYCARCNELVDYVTKILIDNKRSEWEITAGVCETCNTPVKQKWQDGDPCPRCGGSFDETGQITMWD